ncbi:MAG: NAD(P)H-hydrate dehydratase [Candidatus Bathyarchaeia archaeon]
MSLSTREMRVLELNSEYFGLSRLQMMENAGFAVASEVAKRFGKESRVTVFCGLGGNGGDGLVAARHLLCMGYDVEVILAGRHDAITSRETRQNWLALESLKTSVKLYEFTDSSQVRSVDSEVVIDALLGVGLRGLIRPPILQMVKAINSSDAYTVSVDVPTGIDSDTGEVWGEAVKADLTVTFHKPKKGLLRAGEYSGEVVTVSIGIPPELERFAGPGDVSIVVKPRSPTAHKGDFGRLLVIGGSETYSGAPALVAQAALRTGVDLVYVAAPAKTAYVISSMSPDMITLKLSGGHLNPGNVGEIEDTLKRVDCVVLGPGLGLHEDVKKAVDELLQLIEDLGTPLLLDADGLKAYAELNRRLKNPTVLTPHAGEYRILTGDYPPEGLDAKAEHVKLSARRFGATILLKGAVDVISDGDRVKLNFTGNPGMTVGGTGDVLSGVVGGLMANKVQPFEAAAAGAFINGAAGDFVKRERGFHMVASDLIEWIPKVMDDPMSHAELRRDAYKQG